MALIGYDWHSSVNYWHFLLINNGPMIGFVGQLAARRPQYSLVMRRPLSPSILHFDFMPACAQAYDSMRLGIQMFHLSG